MIEKFQDLKIERLFELVAKAESFMRKNAKENDAFREFMENMAGEKVALHILLEIWQEALVNVELSKENIRK